LDRGVGEVVAALKESGAFDNTIIILTSDNGPWYEGSPGPYRGRKGQTFEGGMHVPFLIHWPKGLAGGRTLPNMAMGNDLFPTLLDWVNLPAPQDRAIDGRSLRPLFEGKSPAAPRIDYYYSGNRLMAVSDGRFKYHDQQPINYVISNMRISPPTLQGPWLFDLSTDADESYNVAMKYPQEAVRMKAALDARVAEDRTNLRGWK
jgi:arylsulfatase A-like enzyme